MDGIMFFAADKNCNLWAELFLDLLSIYGIVLPLQRLKSKEVSPQIGYPEFPWKSFSPGSPNGHISDFRGGIREKKKAKTPFT